MIPNPKNPTSGRDGTSFKTLYIPNATGENKFTSAQMNEDDYLQTETWKKIREARLKMDGYKCQQCGRIAAVVHHIKYPDVWGMEDIVNDLISLCDSCHAIIHRRNIK